MGEDVNVQTVTHPTTSRPGGAEDRRRIRVWPAVVLLAAYWTCQSAVTWIEMTMFARFISRWLGLGVLLLGFTIWWLTNRGIRLRDRFLAAGLLILCWIAAARLADPSVGPPVLLMLALPCVFTAWTAWLLVSRNRSVALQRVGICVATVLVFGYVALLRWDGLDGALQGQFSWRWSPSAEAQFLATKSRAEGPTQASTSAREWDLQPGDWPEFRGAQRDGVVTGAKIADWGEHPPQPVWRHRVGPGWSSMIVVDGFLVTQEQRGPAEAVVCYDAATGQEVWAHEDAVRFSEGLAGPGPRGTPTFRGGRIYALGAKGLLNCLKAASGEVVWSHDVAADAGAQVPQWGYAVSPLVVDGKVIVYAGGDHDRSLLAYRADTGELAWTRAGGKQSYSSPQLVTFQGRRQILMHDDRALMAVSPEDGALLWERLNSSKVAIPMLQPRPLGAGELLLQADAGTARIAIHLEDGHWSTADRWNTTRLKPAFNDFVDYQGHLYGLDDGILCCLDGETGRRLWKDGRYGHGQLLLLADQGLLVVLTDTGEVALVSANPERHEERGRFQAIEGKTWNHPVIAHGRLFVRNGEEMACYQLRLAGAP